MYKADDYWGIHTSIPALHVHDMSSMVKYSTACHEYDMNLTLDPKSGLGNYHTGYTRKARTRW